MTELVPSGYAYWIGLTSKNSGDNRWQFINWTKTTKNNNKCLTMTKLSNEPLFDQQVCSAQNYYICQYLVEKPVALLSIQQHCAGKHGSAWPVVIILLLLLVGTCIGLYFCKRFGMLCFKQ